MSYPSPHAPPCWFRCVSPSPSHRYRCTRSSSRSSPRLARRIVVSLCRLSIRSHIRCGFDFLLTAAGSVVVVSSRREVPSCVSCFLAARLAFPLHLIGYRLARPSPRSLDTIGGACGGELPVFSACLTSSCGLCRYLPMSIASSFRFHPLRCHLSACLLCRLGCVGDSVLISSCGMYCDVLLAHRLISSLVSPVISSVGSVSVSSLAPPFYMIGGAGSDCGWLSFSVSISC